MCSTIKVGLVWIRFSAGLEQRWESRAGPPLWKLAVPAKSDHYGNMIAQRQRVLSQSGFRRASRQKWTGLYCNHAKIGWCSAERNQLNLDVYTADALIPRVTVWDKALYNSVIKILFKGGCRGRLKGPICNMYWDLFAQQGIENTCFKLYKVTKNK